MLTPVQENYLTWLRANYPEIYNQYVAPKLERQLGDDSSNTDDQSTFASIIDSITSAIPSLAQAYTANKAASIAQQTAVAKASLPKSGFSSISTTTLLIGGGVLLGGLLLLRRK